MPHLLPRCTIDSVRISPISNSDTVYNQLVQNAVEAFVSGASPVTRRPDRLLQHRAVVSVRALKSPGRKKWDCGRALRPKLCSVANDYSHANEHLCGEFTSPQYTLSRLGLVGGGMS